ncbi:MAG TPA: signal peptidase II [Firmicutes bacterium]|nr:signal peptidase II [Bacillota bacterium]
MRYVLTSFLILVADRLSKILVMQHMAEGESIPILAPVLYLTYVRNTGAAFGLLRGKAPVLAGIAVLGVALAAWQWKRIVSQGSRVKWGLAAALAGALGNMIDRLAYGSVIDFFDIRIWPIFNIADLAISCGIVLLFWEVLSHDQR